MKNNRLTARYIKDVFRFMEMYNIGSVNIGSVNFILNIHNEVEYARYCICVHGDYVETLLKWLSSDDDTVYYNGETISELLREIKDSDHYMMELV